MLQCPRWPGVRKAACFYKGYTNPEFYIDPQLMTFNLLQSQIQLVSPQLQLQDVAIGLIATEKKRKHVYTPSNLLVILKPAINGS